jgi:hypothetical protein
MYSFFVDCKDGNFQVTIDKLYDKGEEFVNSVDNYGNTGLY